MQPLVISTSFSSERLSEISRSTSALSMLISLMSLTITATRRPSRFRRISLSSVVFPAPRKPDSTVTGSRVSTMISSVLPNERIAVIRRRSRETL